MVDLFKYVGLQLPKEYKKCPEGESEEENESGEEKEYTKNRRRTEKRWRKRPGTLEKEPRPRND